MASLLEDDLLPRPLMIHNLSRFGLLFSIARLAKPRPLLENGCFSFSPLAICMITIVPSAEHPPERKLTRISQTPNCLSPKPLQVLGLHLVLEALPSP